MARPRRFKKSTVAERLTSHCATDAVNLRHENKELTGYEENITQDDNRFTLFAFQKTETKKMKVNLLSMKV